MVYRNDLTYNEFIDILVIKYIALSFTGHTLPPSIFEISFNNSMLKSLIPDEVKANVIVDDLRIRSSLATNKTKRATKKSFFFTILEFTQSHSDSLNNLLKGDFQIIRERYKCNKRINITGFQGVHLKYDCIKGPFVNSVRESILYSFSFIPLPGHRNYKDPGVKLFRRKTNLLCLITQSVLKTRRLQIC